MRVLRLAAGERPDRPPMKIENRSTRMPHTWRPPCGPPRARARGPSGSGRRGRCSREDRQATGRWRPSAATRARASASSTASSVSAGRAGTASSAASTTRGMSRKPIRSARNAGHGDLVGGVQDGGRGAARPAPASRASGRHRKASSSGASKSRRRPTRSIGAPRGAAARGAAGRSRSARACRGARSGPAGCRRRGAPWRGPSTAGAPRPRSGRSASPNRWCASITSRPLFMSVAESIVIFAPIVQVGCRSASAGVTARSSSAARPRNGPPDAVRIAAPRPAPAARPP